MTSGHLPAVKKPLPLLGERAGVRENVASALNSYGLTLIELRQQPRSGEEAELDDLGFGGVLNRQPVERFVHVKQPLPVMIIGDLDPSEGNPLQAAAVADLLF